MTNPESPLNQSERVAVSLAALRIHEARPFQEKLSIVERALRQASVAAAIAFIMTACGGAAYEPESEPIPAPEPAEWCGYSFDQAVEVFAPERVCQTTVYDLTTGYCTFWEPCSSIEH